MTDLLDADLLLGRDITTGAEAGVDDLSAWMTEVGVVGGLLGSQRALQFDAASGNAEAAEAASRLGLVPTLSLETRDWLGARAALESAGEGTVVRLAPQRQDCLPTHPGFRAIVADCAERGFPVLTEGDLRVWGPAFEGRGMTVVFLDAHFYHLGDFVALASAEEGFLASTRLLNGPDSLSQIRDELGIERLVFGSRAGFSEGRSALDRLMMSDLSDADKGAVAHGNLARLLGRDPGGAR